MRLSQQLAEEQQKVARLTAANARLVEQNDFCLSEIERYRAVIEGLSKQLEEAKATA